MMAVLLVVSVSFLGADASLHHQISSMVRADVAILVLESLVIFFYLYGNYSSLISRPSASLLLAGDFALLFWAGFVASGLAVPLIFELTHWSLGGGAGLGTQVGLTVAASVSGLFGGLILRYLIIAGGVRVPIQVAGMMVTTSGKARL
jgi:formate-dependent nitrite reductase membrane component NrfD